MSETSMIVVSGEPYDWNWCYQFVSKDWTSCLNLCLEDASCIAVYMNSSTGVCYQCQIGQINSIKYSSNQVIGFKASVTECAETLLDEYSTPEYTVTYNSSDEIWTFSYVDSKSCEDGWALSNRETVQWCLQLFVSVINGYNGSVSFCEEEDAVVSAVGSDFESNYLTKKAYEYFSGSELKAIITDGYMKEECIYAFYTRIFTSECEFPTAFTWNDQYVTDFSSYKWTAGNPDCEAEIQFCLVQYSQKGVSYYDGLTDTAQCFTDSDEVHDTYSSDFTFISSSNEFNAVLCGKLAT